MPDVFVSDSNQLFVILRQNYFDFCKLAELASKVRELIVPVREETKLAHISKTKHFRHMMRKTRNDFERSRVKRGELAELALLRKARELIVPVKEETKLAHISKTKHFRHMMYRTRNDYFHPYYRYP